jgi:hypothetical protein
VAVGDRRQQQHQQQQEPPYPSHGVRFQTPQSLLISSTTAGNHQVMRVAAHTNIPCKLPPRQPRSPTLNLIPSTTLRSVPITVKKAPAPMKYRPSRLLLPYSRMLKQSASSVLASFRPSTYPRGYASALHSLRPCWTALLSILREQCSPVVQHVRTIEVLAYQHSFSARC